MVPPRRDMFQLEELTNHYDVTLGIPTATLAGVDRTTFEPNEEDLTAFDKGCQFAVCTWASRFNDQFSGAGKVDDMNITDLHEPMGLLADACAAPAPILPAPPMTAANSANFDLCTPPTINWPQVVNHTRYHLLGIELCWMDFGVVYQLTFAQARVLAITCVWGWANRRVASCLCRYDSLRLVFTKPLNASQIAQLNQLATSLGSAQT